MSTDDLAAGGRGGLLRLVVAGCAAAAALLLTPVAALAEPDGSADSDGSAVTWSVVPAGSSGPDGRSTITHELAPGEQVSDRIAVRNLSDVDVTFDLAAADGFYTAEGHFDMLAAGQESSDAGTWIDVPGSVTVAAGQTVVVPFTLTVPERAQPGDHAAGVAASVQAGSARGADGAEMAVRTRVGIQVMTRVTGELAATATLSGASLDYQWSAHPLRPGTATATVLVTNTGNVQLTASGQVRLGDHQVAFPAEGQRPQSLLPGEQRTVTVTMPQVWPTGPIDADIVLTPDARTIDGKQVPAEEVRTSVSAWAVPVPQLLTLLGAGLLVAAVVGWRVRARRRLVELLAEARAAGRREAGSGQVSS